MRFTLPEIMLPFGLGRSSQMALPTGIKGPMGPNLCDTALWCRVGQGSASTALLAATWHGPIAGLTRELIALGEGSGGG